MLTDLWPWRSAETLHALRWPPAFWPAAMICRTCRSAKTLHEVKALRWAQMAVAAWPASHSTNPLWRSGYLSSGGAERSWGLVCYNLAASVCRLQRCLKFPKMKEKYTHPGAEHDQLFAAAYEHQGSNTCASYNFSQAIRRPPCSGRNSVTLMKS